MEWGLMAGIADQFHQLGASGQGLTIYRELAKTVGDTSLKHAFLKRGIALAKAANEVQLAAEWETIIAPPPPPPPETP
jgi:hypothetical protein